ncbi:metal/formaldehyde-sensitive transcriptional repressor [Hyphomicrobiales bacterium 4NK60-0047b]|jgi:DNA-binding FrmR family transcriptional regulator
MSHLSRNKSKLITRLRRIKGQVEGVERSLEQEAACGEILRQIASVRGAITGLTNEVLVEHMRNHLVNAPTASEREQATTEMIEILKSYMK